MFQRLKGAIDSRIAEEQARQRSAQSPSRSNSGAKKPQPRAISSNRRSSQARSRERHNGSSPQKSPDPSEFEPELVVEDEEGPSRSGTPRPAEVNRQDESTDAVPKDGEQTTDSQTGLERSKGDEPLSAPISLPPDVKAKLRKLEKLESRYHELLRSYRIAHARVLSIEPFETSLRENTPLTSITDPGALTEYLNQLNLKGDMVLDELKRVSSERDSYKQKLTEAENRTSEAYNEIANLRKFKVEADVEEALARQANGVHVDKEAIAEAPEEKDPLDEPVKSPTASIKSRASSIPGLSLFSPKPKPVDTPKVDEKTEEFFSYESEMPKLDTELQERQDEVTRLRDSVKTMEGDLAVAKESTQNMVGTLQGATAEINALKERKGQLEMELRDQTQSSEKIASNLRSDLQAKEQELQDLIVQHEARESELTKDLKTKLHTAETELVTLRIQTSNVSDQDDQHKFLLAKIDRLTSELAELHEARGENERRISTLKGLVDKLRSQLTASEDSKEDYAERFSKGIEVNNGLAQRVLQLQSDITNLSEAAEAKPEATEAQPNVTNGLSEPPKSENHATVHNKKKNKKKKKAGKPIGEQSKDNNSEHGEEAKEVKAAPSLLSLDSSNTITRLEEELAQLRTLLDEKDAAIDRMYKKLKNEEELREEIEGLRDDLLNIGQEHVEAKDKAKGLSAEKALLEAKIADLEKDLVDLRAAYASSTSGAEEQHKDLTTQFEDLKVKAMTMQTDLSIAQQLALARFKDLTDLRAILQKTQPEISALKEEVSNLRPLKDELEKTSTELIGLEAKHEDARTELAGLKRTANERELEIKILNQKIDHESDRRLKAERSNEDMTSDLQRLDTEKRQAVESLDRLAKELARSKDELLTARARVKEVEQRLSNLGREREELKEDIELKSAQHASAQSLMSSMRDQTAEMTMQIKEARERCDSLEEEIADAHRLLSERTREAETMRRLLADVESRADSRIREMKERMDIAIEERDRAEDEASTAGRRRARELEELRNKVRDVERGLKRAEEEKEELEVAQRDWKRRREELEHRSEQENRGAEEVRKAMGELRDALDESERQARDLEKQKADLRRSMEDTQGRLEKLQKSNKTIADELQTLRSSKRGVGSEVQSSRSSIDSTPSRVRLASPNPSRKASGTFMDKPNGQVPTSMDFVYLKNVLLQFLEQKDKKHQLQLIPVLGMLLHFDRKDEQKLMAVITAK